MPVLKTSSKSCFWFSISGKIPRMSKSNYPGSLSQPSTASWVVLEGVTQKGTLTILQIHVHKRRVSPQRPTTFLWPRYSLQSSFQLCYLATLWYAAPSASEADFVFSFQRKVAIRWQLFHLPGVTSSSVLFTDLSLQPRSVPLPVLCGSQHLLSSQWLSVTTLLPLRYIKLVHMENSFTNFSHYQLSTV